MTLSRVPHMLGEIFLQLLKKEAASGRVGPLVFWDGYGLTNPQSGIFVYAKKLAEELNKLEIAPIVLSKIDLKDFPGVRKILIPPCIPLHSRFFARIENSKPIWPLCIGSFLVKNLKKNPSLFEGRNIVLHGLSNLNLPYLKSLRPKMNGSAHYRTVLTVHDLIPRLDATGVSFALRHQFKVLFPLAVNAADAIICDSKWTRETLIQNHPLAASKAIVISCGVPPLDLTACSGRKRLKKRTSLLAVSRYEVYKRLDFLLEILRAKKGEFQLTIITDIHGKKILHEKGADLVQEGRLELKVNCSQEELSRCYQESDVYLAPSLYEGFCLPAAEALSKGTPVVYQKGSATQEVVGSVVGIGLSREHSPQDWCDAIEKAVELSEDSQFSDNLKQHFSQLGTWKSAAEKLREIYNAV